MALTGSYFEITETVVGTTSSSVTYPADFAVEAMRGVTEIVSESIISTSYVEVEGVYSIIHMATQDWYDDGKGGKNYMTEMQVRNYASSASRAEDANNFTSKNYEITYEWDDDQPMYPQLYTALKTFPAYVSMSNA